MHTNKPPFTLPLPTRLHPFEYLPEVDCFVATPLFEQVIRYLGLMEWTPVVWMGRYFTLDNDYGEHWFDNWAGREAIRFHPVVNLRGLDETELFVIDPERHSNGQDGPCHPPDLRKMFWTEVMKSLNFSLEFLFAEARFNKQEIERIADIRCNGHELERKAFLEEIDNYVPDLESRMLLLTVATAN